MVMVLEDITLCYIGEKSHIIPKSIGLILYKKMSFCIMLEANPALSWKISVFD